MKYEYTSVTGKYEIEIDEQFYDILHEMDREERNADRKYYRNNPIPLSNIDFDGKWMDDGTDILGDLIEAEDRERLYTALTQLTDNQQALIKLVFFEGVTPSEIAQRDSVDKSAISHRLALIYTKMKNILNSPSTFVFFEAI